VVTDGDLVVVTAAVLVGPPQSSISGTMSSPPFPLLAVVPPTALVPLGTVVPPVGEAVVPPVGEAVVPFVGEAVVPSCDGTVVPLGLGAWVLG